MAQIFTFLFRFFGRIVLIVYFLAAVLLLGVRYWVLPNIDQWRPYIARQLSTALDTQVSLGKVQAEWNGLYPSLQLTTVDFTDRKQRVILSLAHLRAVLGWRGLLQGKPELVSLQASGLDISVRRDRRNRLWVLGQSFDLNATAESRPGPDLPGLAWLLRQRLIVLNDTTIRWVDERRSTSPLVLSQVALTVSNPGTDSRGTEGQNAGLDGYAHRFSLTAKPPAAMGDRFDLRGQFGGQAGKPGSAAHSWGGQLYVNIDAMRPLAWQPWLGIPDNFESGQVSAQVWLTIEQAKIDQLVSQISTKDSSWSLGAQTHIKVGAASLYFSGPKQAFLSLWPNFYPDSSEIDSPVGDAQGLGLQSAVQFRIEAQSLHAEAEDIFPHPLKFDLVQAQGTMARQDNHALRLAFGGVHLVNDALEAQLSGDWQQGGRGSAGIADINGVFKRAAITAIDEYLPLAVDHEVREWMAGGLVDGQIHDAQLLLKGDLEDFPFGDHPEQGDFSVHGSYTGGIIDYLPGDNKKPGWPRLTDMSGKVAMRRADLRLIADTATIWSTKGQAISLHDVKAHIPDLENDSVLAIQGDTTAQAGAYLALMQHSPLGGLLDHAFDRARADGVWKVPLRLSIPLLHARDTLVKGAVQFADSTVSLMPDAPEFSHVRGTLDFSDKGFNTDDLKAQFLEGPISLAGGMNDRQNGMRISGSAQAAALTDYVGLVGMRRLKGHVPYKISLQREKSKKYVVTFDSDLIGVALDLPKPLGKSAQQSMPLHLRWSPGPHGTMKLDASLDKKITLVLLHDEADKSPVYFQSGSLGLNNNPALLPGGLNIDIQYPDVDIDAWTQIVDEFSSFLPQAAKKQKFSPLPAIQQIRLEADTLQFKGAQLSQAMVTARQSEPLTWRLDVSSSQTAGTLFWKKAHGKIAGSVKAKFDRLALGSDASPAAQTTQAESEPTDKAQPSDEYLDFPAIDLQVNRFKLYGHPMGQLSLQGTNQARGELWKLDKLSLAGPSFELNGAGTWRLSGPDRGLVLDAQVKTADLGKYLEHMGYQNLMRGGSGTLNGRIEWHNLPWAYDKSDLNGQIEVALKKGRFNNLNSRTARLLELLSLQSVSRLASFKWNPVSLMKEGFPYDNLRGTILIRQGVMTTENYRVIGPVGTIVLGGDIDLNTDKLALQAVVIPNLDVSGAAIAAGIAINPVVGIGAFLGQLLLRAPLAKAMTVQYQISGDWDDPKVKETPVTMPAKGAHPAASHDTPTAKPKGGKDEDTQAIEKAIKGAGQDGLAGSTPGSAQDTTGPSDKNKPAARAEAEQKDAAAQEAEPVPARNVLPPMIEH